MKIFFRVDCGNHIGDGHLSRCRNLAIEFKKRGHEIHFIVRDHQGSNYSSLSNFHTHLLGSDSNLIENSNHSFWNGASITAEVQDLNKVNHDEGGADLLIVDHYSLSRDYETKVDIEKVFVIDDLTIRVHHCDYLLNQNLNGNQGHYQENNSKENAHYFLGPNFSLLSENFTKIEDKRKKSTLTKVEDIGIYFGGSDLSDETLKTIEGFSGSHYKLHIILKESHPTFSQVSELAGQNSNIKIYSFVEDMASFVLKMDIVLGACGMSVWERMSLGIPNVLISIGENQRAVLKSLQEHEIIHYLGDGDQTTSESWKSFCLKLPTLTSSLSSIAKRGLSICDGKGVQKIVDYLEK